MTRTIISLTTIPSRLPHIGPTLASLRAQTAAIERVILWLPEQYRRSEFNRVALPPLPEDIEIRRCPFDYGPATKILPAVSAFAGEDVRILYCDDDRLYHPDWAARLLAESDRYPDAAIAACAESAASMVHDAFRTTWTYRALRIASLGLYKRRHRAQRGALARSDGLFDIAKGFGGVVVRPHFFGQAAFTIPDVLWTVDDIWLSGHLAVAGIPLRKVSNCPSFGPAAAARIDALLRRREQNHGRLRANLACIRYFQEHYGIWRAPQPLTPVLAAA